MALISDAISHSILLGIVGAFFIVKNINSPLLVVGAALVGILSVWLIELVANTKRVANDAAIGLVFPALFSIAVILITRYAGSVHLDTDAVLLGEISFTPLDRYVLFGLDLPASLWVMGVILLVNVLFIAVFYKELKLSTFDAGLAISLGFAPGVLHYVLVALVSVTAVGAFEAVGSILVVALMIAPPAAAYLLTNRLDLMLVLSCLFAALSAIGGFFVSRWSNVSTAGSMAAVCGVVFILAFLLAPEQGVLAQWLRRRRQRFQFAIRMLSVHLLNHEGTEAEACECNLQHVGLMMRWTDQFTQSVVTAAERAKYVMRENDLLKLTTQGRSLAQSVMAE
jgi:manganese/zinc/iron transport system permease protein